MAFERPSSRYGHGDSRTIELDEDIEYVHILIDVDRTLRFAYPGSTDLNELNKKLIDWLLELKSQWERKGKTVKFSLFTAQGISSAVQHIIDEHHKALNSSDIISLHGLEERLKSRGIVIEKIYMVADALEGYNPGDFYERHIRQLEYNMLDSEHEDYVVKIAASDVAYNSFCDRHFGLLNLEVGENGVTQLLINSDQIDKVERVFLKSGLLKKIMRSKMGKESDSRHAFFVIDDNNKVVEDLLASSNLSTLRDNHLIVIHACDFMRAKTEGAPYYLEVLQTFLDLKKEWPVARRVRIRGANSTATLSASAGPRTPVAVAPPIQPPQAVVGKPGGRCLAPIDPGVSATAFASYGFAAGPLSTSEPDSTYQQALASPFRVARRGGPPWVLAPISHDRKVW